MTISLLVFVIKQGKHCVKFHGKIIAKLPCSPDLTSDLFIFPYPKKLLKDTYFQTINGVKKDALIWLQFFRDCIKQFHHWLCWQSLCWETKIILRNVCFFPIFTKFLNDTRTLKHILFHNQIGIKQRTLAKFSRWAHMTWASYSILLILRYPSLFCKRYW